MIDNDNNHDKNEDEMMIPFFSIASRDFDQDLTILKKVLHQFEQRTHSENAYKLSQRATLAAGWWFYEVFFKPDFVQKIFQALYEKIGQKEGFDKLFDIVAGTSSGAMNGAILVSHVIENQTWEGSQDKLDAFWKYVSTDVDLRYWYPYTPNKNDWVSQWNIQKQIFPNLAPGESARRYYSAKQFLCSGVPRVRPGRHLAEQDNS